MLARPSEAPRRAEVPPPVFVALVTGAASGIGRATALRLSGSGAALALLDRDADGVAAVADEALDAGAADALTFAADVASADGVERAFAEATDRLGPLDALACAAGILEPAGLADTTEDSWQRHFDVNTTGVLHCLQAARPRPRLRDGGAVVVVSSNAARVPRTGMLAYAASKAATSALARCAGLELAARGIRCNVVEPGSTDTPMLHSLWPDEETGLAGTLRGNPDAYRVGIPLGRLGTPEEFGATAAFLASPLAAYVTGSLIRLDGGAVKAI